MTNQYLTRTRVLGSLLVLGILFILSYLQDVLSLAPGYRALYNSFPYYIPEGGKSLLQVALAVSAAHVFVRGAWRGTLDELGIFAPVTRGLGFGLGAAGVMFLGFAATLPFKMPSDILSVMYLAVLSPFAEEVVFRAFGVGMLHTSCKLPQWLALLLPALVFGLAHLQRGAMCGCLFSCTLA